MMPRSTFTARRGSCSVPARLNELGPIATALGAKRVLVVSDPGIVAAGHTPRGIDSLEAIRH